MTSTSTSMAWMILFVLGLTYVSVSRATTSLGKSDCHDSLCRADPLGFEAIVQLHAIIDDDHNGNLDRSESDGYFRDELQHEDGAARQATFHGSDDHITVHELWRTWTLSAVYNWTVEDVIFWLSDDVDLPQYAESFRVNALDGHILPRIAVNSNYVSSILNIKNSVHRQKMAIKSSDLVLFGQKNKGHNWIKDLLLVVLFLFALALTWWARRQNRKQSSHIHRVMGELEGLQKSEDNLRNLQHRYEQTKKEHLQTAIEKQHLEQTMKDEISQAKSEAERLKTTREATEEEISRLKLAERELIEVRKALADSERCNEQMRQELPPLLELQQWLQLTFEIETQHYEAKREAAERHLRIAREMCDRVRKKRSGLLGSLRIAHSTSLDDTDQSIMQARGALEEVKLHLQERSHRWQEVENICGFDVIQNPGLPVLETSLRGVGSTYLTGSCGGGLSKSASTSTFSALTNLAPDVELDEDISTSHLQAVGLLPVCSTQTLPVGIQRTNSSAANLGQVHHNSVRQYPDHRVWPNLMKAGMQLTMFGLGLTNPQLGAHHPREKRRTLTDSVNDRQSTSQLVHRNVRSSTQNMPRSETAGQLTTAKVNGTGTGSITVNGDVHTDRHEPVKFGLHEDSRSSLESSADRQTVSSGHSGYVQSQSVEASATQPRPETLTTSASDSALGTPQHPSLAPRTPEHSPERDPPSHGSTDSLDLTADHKKPRRKPGIKMPKIFKKKEL